MGNARNPYLTAANEDTVIALVQDRIAKGRWQVVAEVRGMKPIVPIKLEVGARVRYTGDMANASGLGVVVAVKEKAFGASYQIVMDDGRDKTVDAYSFDGGPGCRFFVMPGIAGADEIAGLLANAAIVAAKAKADEDAASAAFSAEVARLKVAYAYLEQGDGPAVAAKNLRKILKREFPGVKFSVTISRFSGGNSMRVSWIDGPTSDQVRQLAELFSGGDFDGSNDLYTYADTPFNSLFGDAKYVSTDRNYSDALIGKAIAELAEEYAPAAAPTVEDYRAGNAWNVSPIEGGSYGRDNWQSLINVKCSETTGE